MINLKIQDKKESESEDKICKYFMNLESKCICTYLPDLQQSPLVMQKYCFFFFGKLNCGV